MREEVHIYNDTARFSIITMPYNKCSPIWRLERCIEMSYGAMQIAPLTPHRPHFLPALAAFDLDHHLLLSLSIHDIDCQ